MKYFQDGGNVPYKDGQDVVDLADIGLFGRRALLKRGFVYQDPTTGELRQYSGNDIHQLNRDIREARRNERIDNRFGANPNISNWSENAQSLYRKRIGTNTPYITLTTPQNTPIYQTTPKKSYRYSFENNNMAKAYQELVSALYANESYDILDKYLTDGKITGSGITNTLGDSKFKDYVNSLLNAGLNQDQIDKILKLVPEWRPNPKPVFNPTTEQIKAYQKARGLPVTGKRLNMTKEMEKTYPITADSFYNNFYIVDQDGIKYYLDANGNYYTQQKGDTPGTFTYNNGTYTFNKKGGKMIYFQNGGIVQQDDQKQILKTAFTAAAKGDMETLTKVLGITTEEQFKKFIELTTQMSQQKEDPEMAEMATLALQGLSKVTKASKGTKLDYIKMLHGQCPEGYEMTYFKLGGKVCKKCQKIEEACKGKKMKCGGESPVVSEFKKKRKK